MAVAIRVYGSGFHRAVFREDSRRAMIESRDLHSETLRFERRKTDNRANGKCEWPFGASR